MAIIKEQKTGIELKKDLNRKKIEDGLNAEFKEIKKRFDDNFTMVWHNADGLTAQQVFDSFGTDAAQLFLIAGHIQNALNAIKPGTLTQVPPKAYTINSDGTVTVSE